MYACDLQLRLANLNRLSDGQQFAALFFAGDFTELLKVLHLTYI